MSRTTDDTTEMYISDTAYEYTGDGTPPSAIVFVGDSIARYVPEPSHCTMEPDGYYGEQYGIYKCSNCGELWQFECDGPKQHKWTCCPKCRAIIDYGEEA